MDACCVVLAHVTWALAQEWALSKSSSQNSYMGAYPGHYGIYQHTLYVYGQYQDTFHSLRDILVNL